MPYIKQEDRKANNPLVSVIESEQDLVYLPPIALRTPGELNFAMTVLASAYVRRRGVSYTVLNDVVGVFASAMAEFQRRVVAPYEDIKRVKNGEVYAQEIIAAWHMTKEIDDAEPDSQT